MNARVLIAALLLATLAGCSSSTPTEAPAPKRTTEQLTAREGFQKLFVTARGWSTDSQPYALESSPTSDSDGHDGKAAIWRASFASGARGKIQTFQWTGSAAPSAPSPGVSHGTEDTYTTSNSSTAIFDAQYLKTDSDQAFTLAQQHGGEKLIKANPHIPVTYRLFWDPRKLELDWHVLYGARSDAPELAVDINATTGAFLRTEK